MKKRCQLDVTQLGVCNRHDVINDHGWEKGNLVTMYPDLCLVKLNNIMKNDLELLTLKKIFCCKIWKSMPIVRQLEN